MPRSMAARMIRKLSCSSTRSSPRCQPPRPIAETLSPVLPSVRQGIVDCITSSTGSNPDAGHLLSLDRRSKMKIGVIGAGAVGSACLLSSIVRGIAREIVVVNRDRNRTKAVVTDLQYGAAFSSVVPIRDGDYADLRGAALVMLTAGRKETAGGAT